MHLKHLEKSESTAWNVIRMIINEFFLNQISKANLVSIETGLKIELDLISVQNFILIPIFGPILLVALLFWFKNFSFIIILITFQAVLSEFSRCFKCILNIFENQQKIKKIHKFYFFIFSKIFLHNHYLKLFLDWFTRNFDFNCGG